MLDHPTDRITARTVTMIPIFIPRSEARNGRADNPNACLRLEGIHHVTWITGDARRTSTSTRGVLGLCLVKKTVNQDDPTVHHLFYADEDWDSRAAT